MSEYRIFESLPGLAVLVSADTPRFPVLAATRGFNAVLDYAQTPGGQPDFVAYLTANALVQPSAAFDIANTWFQQVMTTKTSCRVPAFEVGEFGKTEQSNSVWTLDLNPVLDSDGQVEQIIVMADVEERTP